MRILSPRSHSRLIAIWIALSAGGIVLGVILWKHLNESLDAARSLLRDAETYSVARLASRLNDFPILIRSLAGSEIPVSAR